MQQLPAVLNAEIASRLLRRERRLGLSSDEEEDSTLGATASGVNGLTGALRAGAGIGAGAGIATHAAASPMMVDESSGTISGGGGGGGGQLKALRWRNKEVQLSPLGHVPGSRIVRYRGRISLHFIKESTEMTSDEDTGRFFHEFLCEANAMTRGQVAAVGGNTLLHYRLRTDQISESSRGASIYCVLSISGDAVRVEKR
jgi:hypothetical protein